MNFGPELRKKTYQHYLKLDLMTLRKRQRMVDEQIARVMAIKHPSEYQERGLRNLRILETLLIRAIDEVTFAEASNCLAGQE